MKGLDRYVGLTFSTGYETGGTATSNIGFFKDASKTKSMASSRGHILTWAASFYIINLLAYFILFHDFLEVSQSLRSIVKNFALLDTFSHNFIKDYLKAHTDAAFFQIAIVLLLNLLNLWIWWLLWRLIRHRLMHGVVVHKWFHYIIYVDQGRKRTCYTLTVWSLRVVETTKKHRRFAEWWDSLQSILQFVRANLTLGSQKKPRIFWIFRRWATLTICRTKTKKEPISPSLWNAWSNWHSKTASGWVVRSTSIALSSIMMKSSFMRWYGRWSGCSRNKNRSLATFWSCQTNLRHFSCSCWKISRKSWQAVVSTNISKKSMNWSNYLHKRSKSSKPLTKGSCLFRRKIRTFRRSWRHPENSLTISRENLASSKSFKVFSRKRMHRLSPWMEWSKN